MSSVGSQLSTREERRGSWKSGRGMGGCADIGMGSRPAEAWQEVVVAVGGKPAPVIIIAPPPLRRLIARLGPAERAAATLWHPVTPTPVACSNSACRSICCSSPHS